MNPLNQLQDSQRALIEMMQNPNELNLKSTHYSVHSQDRLEVYRTGYFARLVSSMAEGIFEKVSQLLGKPFLYGLLQAFYESHSSPKNNMLESLSPLPQFAKHFAQNYFFLADLLTLCIENIRLLRGPDTLEALPLQQDITQLYLIPEHYYLGASYPLYTLWKKSSSFIYDDKLEGEAEGVLLIKKGVDTIHSIAVPAPLDFLMEALKKGMNLQEAILETQDHFSHYDVLKFQNWMSTLASSGALKTEIALPKE